MARLWQPLWEGDRGRSGFVLHADMNMVKIKINLATGRYAGKGVGIVLPLIIIIFTAAFFLYMRQEAGRSRASAERLEKRIAGLSEKKPPKSENSKDMFTGGPDLDTVRDILDKREFSWIEALDNIEKALPQGISLSSIQPSFKGGGVRLSGMAKDFADLSLFIDRLEGLRVYKRVFLVNHSILDSENGEKSITFNLNIEGANDL